MSGHVILLGDSIFDNRAYVGGGPEVVEQLREVLPRDIKATLLAVDGAVTSSVRRQLERIPSDATYVVVSVGGNDALGESHLLRQAVGTIGEGVGRLAQAQDRFRTTYESMIGDVSARSFPTALCTIYDGNFPPPEGTVIRAALSLFNDVITRAAFKRGLPLIDLRLICDEPGDYANPIEPSVQGGRKIAAAIASLTSEAAAGRSIVIAS